MAADQKDCTNGDGLVPLGVAINGQVAHFGVIRELVVILRSDGRILDQARRATAAGEFDRGDVNARSANFPT